MTNLSAFTLAALVTVGMGGSNAPCHDTRAPAAGRVSPTDSARAAASAPGPALSQLDYIDLRPGSGDPLANLARHLTPDT